MQNSALMVDEALDNVVEANGKDSWVERKPTGPNYLENSEI